MYSKACYSKATQKQKGDRQNMKQNLVVQARVPVEIKLKLKSYCRKHDCTEARALRLALVRFLQKVNTHLNTD